MQTTVETPRATATTAIEVIKVFDKHTCCFPGNYKGLKRDIAKHYKYIHSDSIKPDSEIMNKNFAKQTSKVYNFALSTLPLGAFKCVPKQFAGTLLNAINSGVFKVDGQKMSFEDFYDYCRRIMLAIDAEVARMK